MKGCVYGSCLGDELVEFEGEYGFSAQVFVDVIDPFDEVLGLGLAVV